MVKIANRVLKLLLVAFLLATALLFLIGSIRLGSASLAVAFLTIAAARAQNALPAPFWIRRARTDVVMATVIAVALGTLAVALPWGR